MDVFVGFDCVTETSVCPPQMQAPCTSSMSQVEWLTSRVDDLEAKLAYCGSKMDSLLRQ